MRDLKFLIMCMDLTFSINFLKNRDLCIGVIRKGLIFLGEIRTLIYQFRTDPLFRCRFRSLKYFKLPRIKNQTIKGILIMNLFFKIAAGVLGGVAIVFSLGGFSSKEKELNNEEERMSREVESDEIPDEILDGNLDYTPTPQRRGEKIRRETERNVKTLQDSLYRVSNVLGHVSNIFDSIMKIIYNDAPSNRLKVSPTTYIY